MERHFLLPVTIAAVAHSVLLGLPRGAVPPRTDASPPPGLHDPIVPTIPLVPQEDIPVEPRANSGGSADVVHLPEPVVLERTSPTVFPIVPETNRIPVGHNDVGIPRVPFGAAGDGVGNVGPGIAARATLDHEPRTRVQLSPVYPAAARRDLLEGDVTVEFVVDESGRVQGPRIVGSVNPVFDEAALAAIAKWRFEPGTIRGVPVRFRMVVPLQFRLSD